MKKFMAILAVFIAMCIFSGCGYVNRELTNSSNNKSSSRESNTSSEDSVQDNYLTSESNLETNQVEIPEPRKTAIGKSDKSVDGLMQIKATTVRNDKTGNWRYSIFSESGFDMPEYALSYYKEYFKSDKEIHAVINFANKTTTRISCMGEMLFVTVLKYVEKEENDANLMFSGEVIKDYIVYTDNGDIEEVTEPEDKTMSVSTTITSSSNSASSTSTITSSSSMEFETEPPMSSYESKSSSSTKPSSTYSKPETTTTYVLNTNTKKFHYPSCSEVKKIKSKNYSTISSRSAAINRGYSPCKRCKP